MVASSRRGAHLSVCRPRAASSASNFGVLYSQEPVTDSQLVDKVKAIRRGATTFVILYPYTTECSYEWIRPDDLKLFDPCQPAFR